MPDLGRQTASLVMRTIILSVVVLVGCTSRPTSVTHVVASDFHSAKIERELKFYVANFSTYPTNHFYVGPTELDGGQLVRALVYWKEPRIIMPYGELADDAPGGTEIFAWQGHHLKLDRDTVDMGDDIAGSTYLETHRQWVDWMEQCISRGKLYVISVDEATNLFPNADRAHADKQTPQHLVAVTHDPELQQLVTALNAANTQTEMNLASKKISEFWDAKLASIESHIAQKLDGEQRKAFADSNERWRSYRTQEVRFRSEFFTGGSVQPLVLSECYSEITKHRVAELDSLWISTLESAK